ncbi:hypothetical protein L5515_013295 [Caenorhabditis briggsae]|uniref:Fucosyltransferase n=1 Tax=Caenorhabditis briggsae TaxID=6238 RepID=A0AAE9EA82_CAEBR|nr:hypothetical protein L5515_013295 [Caenorhabditis briggsae]
MLDFENACSISSHRAHFSQANAVLFHSRNINSKEISSFPFPRRQEIPYVMVAYESPYNAKLETYKDFFNWTMSYRIDSDVFAPYGGLLRNSELVKVNYAKIWRSKTKGTLWLVSNNNVNNKRKKIVEKLIENGMKVDLYGKVYNREPDNCPRDGAQEGCDERFQSPYKFVIAFENSNCKDYVTEKFWRKAEQYKMVPIVMSRKIYKDLGIPDNMYIAVDDFKTLKEFVEFIENLTSNEKEYMKYHKWREEFRIAEANQEIFGFCDLCQKLMDFQNRTIPKKSYSSLIAWHNEENCDNSFVDRYL